MSNLKNIFGFKTVKDFSDDSVFYDLIGLNVMVVHDKFLETVQVIDDVVGGEETVVTYDESRFFDEYGGYHLGTDDASIEDLVKFEYKFLIDCERSDFSATETVMNSMDKPVKFADIAHQNFN
jgi:hypothetical protein